MFKICENDNLKEKIIFIIKNFAAYFPLKQAPKNLYSILISFQMTGLTKNPLAGLAALGLAGAIPTNTGGLNQTGINNCNCQI